VESFTLRAIYPLEEEPPGPIGWMDPRAGLDDVEKRKFLTLPRLEFSS
jgi:hypothetical protein